MPHIFAVGDVIGFPALAATSMDQGRLAAIHAFGEPARGLQELQPIGIYTVPEISYCGKTEAELTESRGALRGGHLALPRAGPGRDRRRLLRDAQDAGLHEDRTLLGVHVFGTGATDLVHIGQAIMACGGTVDYLVDTVLNYPTLSEAYKVAALDVSNKIRALDASRHDGDWERRRPDPDGSAGDAVPVSQGLGLIFCRPRWSPRCAGAGRWSGRGCRPRRSSARP